MVPAAFFFFLSLQASGLETGLRRGPGSRAFRNRSRPFRRHPPDDDLRAHVRTEIEAVRLRDISSLEESVRRRIFTPGRWTRAGDADFTGAFNEQMSAFEAEIDRVTSAAEAEVEAARAEAEETRAAAEKAERQATLRAALSQIEVALDTGEPFAGELADLEGLDVPDVLAATAEDGVTPLSELQRTFPEAARSALRAATRGPQEGADPVDRLAAFLARADPTPLVGTRAGDDADARALPPPEGSRCGLGRSRAPLPSSKASKRAAKRRWMRRLAEENESPAAGGSTSRRSVPKKSEDMSRTATELCVHMMKTRSCSVAVRSQGCAFARGAADAKARAACASPSPIDGSFTLGPLQISVPSAASRAVGSADVGCS